MQQVDCVFRIQFQVFILSQRQSLGFRNGVSSDLDEFIFLHLHHHRYHLSRQKHACFSVLGLVSILARFRFRVGSFSIRFSSGLNLVLSSVRTVPVPIEIFCVLNVRLRKSQYGVYRLSPVSIIREFIGLGELETHNHGVMRKLRLPPFRFIITGLVLNLPPTCFPCGAFVLVLATPATHEKLKLRKHIISDDTDVQH